MASYLSRSRGLPFVGRRWITAVAASLALVLFALVPAANVGAATGYPPNALISTYFDARYCGNGAVSVVTDGGGNLIDVCTSTGQRILPVYPDYVASASYAAPYGVPTYTGATAYGYNTNGYGTSGYNTYAANTYGYGAYATGANTGVVRQYTDANTNCANGDVTQTASGYFCTANGVPAFSTR